MEDEKKESKIILEKVNNFKNELIGWSTLKKEKLENDVKEIEKLKKEYAELYSVKLRLNKLGILDIINSTTVKDDNFLSAVKEFNWAYDKFQNKAGLGTYSNLNNLLTKSNDIDKSCREKTISLVNDLSDNKEIYQDTLKIVSENDEISKKLIEGELPTSSYFFSCAINSITGWMPNLFSSCMKPKDRYTKHSSSLEKINNEEINLESEGQITEIIKQCSKN